MPPALRRLAVVLCLTVTLGGCALAGRTLGGYIDDKTLTGAVKTRLAVSMPKTLTRVNVDTFERTVYLTGEVETPQQKSDAEIAAWKTEGVEQVINDLRVRRAVQVSASPPTTTDSPSPLQERLPGVARLDPAPPGGPALAYDRGGVLVATVFVRPLHDVAINGFEVSTATVRPIDHVAIYPVPAGGGQPETLVHIVLWHVSPTAAAALR